MIKIGVVNIDTSHPKSFSEYLSRGNRARYAAIFNDGFRGDDEVAGFMKTANIEKRCSTIAEMVKCVDIGFVHSCNWSRHLEHAQYFIDAGKPVFIDKPIVGSLSDCRKLQKLVEKGAIVLGSSSVRYAEEVTNFLKQPESQRGKIVNIFGSTGNDEFNYAIHSVEAIHALAQSEPVSAKFVGRGRIDDQISETFFIVFKNGITATYHSVIGIWHPFEIVIMTTKGTWQFRIDTAKIYGQLLDRICDYMETGRNNFSSIKELIDSVKIMLAARVSKEGSGEQIRLSDIPDDDAGYDGNAFERWYAACAKKIYL